MSTSIMSFTFTISGDWSIAFGNPGKLALAFIGIAFNIIFFAQYLYFSRLAAKTPRARKDSRNESQDVVEYDYMILPQHEI